MTSFRGPCVECGGAVALRSGPGRSALYRRGLSLPIPPGLAIPTCVECGETYVNGGLEAALNAALEVAYVAWQTAHVSALVARLVEQYSVSQRQIAGICGVTPSHLTHIMKGTSMASVTLVRLLEATVVCPAEFERHLQGLPFEASALVRAVHDKSARSLNGFQQRAGRWVTTPANVLASPPSVANDVAA